MHRLKVVTWNVLADAYIARHDYYGHCDPAHLEADWRRPAVARHLVAFDADVLCLQEVDEAAFSAFSEALGDGYRGRWLQKGLGKPDGCATFVRATWAITSHHELRYADDTGCVALSLTVTRGDVSVDVANTHLKWNPRENRGLAHRGVTQARELLKTLRPPEGLGWLVCGDFNATLGTEVLGLFEAAGLRAAHPESRYTCNSNQWTRKIDFTLYRSLEPVETPPAPSIGPTTPLPGPAMPSDHLPVVTTFQVS